MAKGIASSLARWLIKKSIKSTIHKLIKEKRLILLNADKVSYTDKEGGVYVLTVYGMARRVLNNMGVESVMLGKVGEEDIEGILIGEYIKQKGGKSEIRQKGH